MISLRQHIFSLVAVFVALAVGIAAGSTVVRGPLLDSTRARLESAEENIALERTENDVLAAEVAQLDNWAVDGPAQLLEAQLQDTAVVLVVAGDVDADVVEGMVRSLRTAQAMLLGEIRIAPAVFDPAQVDRVLATLDDAALEGVDTAEPAKVGAAFGTEVGRLVAGVAAEVTDGPSVAADELLRSAFGDYEDAGLVDLLELTRDEIDADAVELVVLTDRNLAADPAPVLGGVIAVSDPAAAGLRVLVAEVGRLLQDNDAPMPSFVEEIRGDGRLRDEVSTVDNAETILGWLAVVIGLQALLEGVVDHYGFREGAARAFPSRSS